jgi:hypothetical protein
MDRRICFRPAQCSRLIRSSSRLPKCQTVTKVSVHALLSLGEVWHCPSHRPLSPLLLLSRSYPQRLHHEHENENREKYMDSIFRCSHAQPALNPSAYTPHSCRPGAHHFILFWVQSRDSRLCSSRLCSLNGSCLLFSCRIRCPSLLQDNPGAVTRPREMFIVEPLIRQ